MAGNVNWYADRVLLEVDGASDELLSAIAYQVEGQAKVNITSNGQVDTGFMRSSVYVVEPWGRGTNYTQRRSEASGLAKRDIADKVSSERHTAFVAVGAEYGIYQEMKRSYLHLALQQVARQTGANLIVTRKVAGLFSFSWRET